MNERTYDIKLILETENKRYEIIGEVHAYREKYGDDADGNRGIWQNCIEVNAIKSIKNEDNNIELISRILSRDKLRDEKDRVFDKIGKWYDDNIDSSHVAERDEAEADYHADLKYDQMKDEGIL